jgi:RNA polymerase sigma factor (sigma-70 family)
MEAKNAVAVFFQKERPKLINFVRKRLDDTEDRDAEDVVQDVMLSIVNNLSFLAPVENMAAYVYRAIKNRIVDHYRKRKERLVHFEDVIDAISGDTMAEFLADVHYDTHNEVEKKEIRDRIMKAIDRLKPDQKAVWTATELEGFTFDELSILWQEPIGTLLARKHRATAILRQKLKDIR